MRALFKIAIFTLLFTGQVYASSPVEIYKDWTVFETMQDNRKICYIATLPIKKEGNYRKRGEPYLIVTRVKGKNTDEISASSGYLYDQKKGAEIEIEKRKYSTFVFDEKAWTVRKEDDVAIIEEMKKNIRLIVRGNSRLGTYSEDTYSLVGFTDAYNKMIELCK